MGRHRQAALLALATALTGVVLSAVSFVRELEDELSLGWLFHIRGNLTPPSNVVIVNTDDASIQLGLPPKLVDWPRAKHAELVDTLNERGASAIAFDITFVGEGRDDDNQVFAESIKRAGRVVLAQLERTSHAGAVQISSRQDPEAVLAEAAQALAPAPLPRLELVNWSWTFTGTLGDDVPTLPAVLLQVHALPSLQPFVDLLERAGLSGPETPRSREDVRRPADLQRFMQTVRQTLRRDSRARSMLLGLASDIASPEGDVLRALAAMYAGEDRTYLNFYGPPETICTISYYDVLGDNAQSECPLRGALVLVGGATGSVRQVDQPDTYPTVFDQPNGVRLSGVEIHATAVANLLTRTSLRVPGVATHVGLLALLGGVLGAAGYYVRTRRRLRAGAVTARIQAAIVVVGLAVAYAVGATIAFQTMYVVMPLVVPLGILLPLALILGLVVKPAEYVEQVEAVCLATDAAGSTAIGQSLSHERYARLMSDYNEALLAPVRARGGAPLEPQGDGFVCLWCAPGKAINPAMRQQACAAALEIADESLRFNRSHADGEQLPTRVGLNVGMVTVYSDADRGVFKAFGDAVNVATRLRDLNVELNTHVLACDHVVEGLGGEFAVRDVPGRFTLKGVVGSTSVFEINHKTRTPGHSSGLPV